MRAQIADHDVIRTNVAVIGTGADSVRAYRALWAHMSTSSAVVGIVVDVDFASVRGIGVAIRESRVAGGNPTDAVHTCRGTVYTETDMAAGAAVVDVVGQVIAIVDHTVAIIVYTVAGFRLRQYPAHARAPGAVRLAGLGAWYTGTYIGATGLSSARSAELIC
jgi:hypothetical protein